MPPTMTTPRDHPEPPTAPLAAAVSRLDRSARIELVASVALAFPTHHPQGLVRSGDQWWLSTVDIEREEGHLLGFDDDGELAADVLLVDGPRFHPGGIDIDGDAIVVPVAEYRPDSTTALFRVDLATGAPEVVSRVDDHLGALAAPRADATTTAMTWGSRRVLTLDADWAVVDRRPNPSHWIDVQDGQRLDDQRVLCSGVAYLIDGNRIVGLGGIGIWDEEARAWTHELPIAVTVVSGRILTNNPVWATLDGNDVLLHAVPDDDTSALLTHRLTPSPS